MDIKQYDVVLLKDGREGDIIEINGDDTFVIDVGSSSKDWETLWSVPVTDIERVIKRQS